jgi:hypothetical protein
MTKRLVDLDDEDLQAARRREIERLTSGALPDLGKSDVRDAAWRS